MPETSDAIIHAAELTAAWLGNPHTRASADEVPAFFVSMHAAVSNLNPPTAMPQEADFPTSYEPAISARKSLASPDHIISMIDGRKYKSLKRHLSANGLTPDQYRERYKLKADYPMVAPAYSQARRTVAKTLGLGRKAGAKVEKAAEGAVKSVRKSGKTALSVARNPVGTPGSEQASETVQS